MTEIISKIPARIKNAAVDGHVCGTEDIIDDVKNKTQQEINTEVEESLGSGGSVDERINQAKTDILGGADSSNNTLKKVGDRVTTTIGGASSSGDTLKKIEDRLNDVEQSVGDGGSVDERIAEEGAKHYLKNETYTKEEVNGLVTTPNQEYVTVTATDQTTAATDVLPATGAADTIYRVGNWDGTQYDTTCYTEYAWNGSAYVKLSTKEVGIDEEPTVGSNNLVKSGGVYASAKNIKNPYYYKVPSTEITIIDNKSMRYGNANFVDAEGESIAIIEAKSMFLRVNGVNWRIVPLAGCYTAYPDITDATINRVPGTGFGLTDNNGYWMFPLGTKYIVVTLDNCKNTAELILGYGDEYGGDITSFADKNIAVPNLSDNQNLLNRQDYIIGIGYNTIIYEIPVTNEKWFVLWGKDGVTNISNAVHSYMEFDENGNTLVDQQFYMYPTQLGFGKNGVLYKKFRLSDGCKKVRVHYVTTNNKMPDYFADRDDYMFINEDGSVPRNRSIVSVSNVILNRFGETIKGKTIVCLGDSITEFGSSGADGGWPWYLQKNLDCAIHNVAVGMNTVCDKADTDITAYSLTGSDPNNTLSTQLRYISHYGIVPDIAIITGGTNDEGGLSGPFDPGDTLQDAINEYQNGTITQEAVRTTMYCAIAHLIAKLRVINPNVKIFVGTTIYRLALSQKERIAAINQIWREIANTFSCEIIDFNNELPLYPAIASFSDENTVNPYYNGYNSQTKDPTHPSQLGVDLMGRLALSVIRKLYKE